MERAGHFRLVVLAANHPARQGHFVPVWALIISGVPFTPPGKVENSDLLPVEQYAGSAIGRNIVGSASALPGYLVGCHNLCVWCRDANYCVSPPDGTPTGWLLFCRRMAFIQPPVTAGWPLFNRRLAFILSRTIRRWRLQLLRLYEAHSFARFCSRNSVNSTVGSFWSGAFTKCVKRLRISGFSTAAFHSHS